MIEHNPIIEYYDQAIALGFAAEVESEDKEYKRLKCIKDFRQPRYGYIEQWVAGEYMEPPLKTEYGHKMSEQRFKYALSEIASDMFNK